MTAITLIGGFKLRQGAHSAEHSGAAGHIKFHFLHVVRGLDGDASGIERDGFADESENRRSGDRCFWRFVGEHHHARRLDAAAPDGQHRAHF